MRKHFYAFAVLILMTAISGCGKTPIREDILPAPPPKVTFSYPPGDTITRFFRNHAITIVFSETMNQSTVPGAFSANGAPGSFHWRDNAVTFVPNAAFDANDTVLVTIASGARDLSDSVLTPAFSKWYLTSDLIDAAAPTVWANHPLPASENMSVSTDVVADASEPLSDWSTGAMDLKDSAGTNVAGSATIIQNPPGIRFDPSSNLSYDTRYYVTVDTTVRDLCWNRLAANYSWSFRTRSDTVKPTVESVSPASGDTSISVNTTVTVRFSEPMDKTTAQASLSLTPVVFFSGYSWQGDTLMTAALAETLSFKKQYRINIDTTARDLSGNHLASTASSSFKTLRGLLVLCNTANEIYLYQQPDLKFEGYLRPCLSPRQVRISSDDSMAYVLTANGVEFFQLKNRNNHLGTVPLPQTCYGLALSYDGFKLAVTDTLNKWLYIINTATMSKIDSVQTTVNYPKGVCFNQGGDKLMVLGWGRVEIYFMDSFHSSPSYFELTALPNGGEEVVYRPWNVIYGASGKGFTIYDLSTFTRTYVSPDISTHPYGLAVSPDWAHLAMSCHDEQTVWIFNASTGVALTSVTVGTRPKSLCYSPDGQKLYVTNSGSGTVSVISRSGNTYTSSSTVTVGAGPWGIAVTP